MPTVEELVALDQITLREHTELAGDVLDPKQQFERLQSLLPSSKCCTVRRNGTLVAYTMMHQENKQCWFVTAFNIHPKQRNSSVLQELFTKFATLCQLAGVENLKSHVYKTNTLSMSFHRRLGFKVTKENSKGVEFFATLEDILQSRAIVRSVKKFDASPAQTVDG